MVYVRVTPGSIPNLCGRNNSSDVLTPLASSLCHVSNAGQTVRVFNSIVLPNAVLSTMQKTYTCEIGLDAT